MAVGLALLVVLPVSVLGGAVAIEGHDPFCASCHTEPEVEYFKRSLAEPSDLASAHAHDSIPCIGCHSGEGLFGRTVSLRQGASDLSAYVSGDYAQPAVTTHPVGESGCTKCHDTPSSSGLYARTDGGVTSSHYHFHEYAAEWLAREPDPRGTCNVCHQAHSVGRLAGQQFAINADVQAACETCHAALSGWIPHTR